MLLILRVLRSGSLHGYGSAQRIHLLSSEVLRVEEGSLYPALQKIAPKMRDPHFESARLWLKKGKATQAASEGETALTLSGGITTDAQIHYLLIRAWQQSGQPERAARHAAELRAIETPAKK